MKTGMVYILLCNDGSFYTGCTSNLEQRLFQHQEGHFPGYTHSRRPLKLVWNSEKMTIGDAVRLERQLKGWRREKKIALISGNTEILQELSVAYRDKDPS